MPSLAGIAVIARLTITAGERQLGSTIGHWSILGPRSTAITSKSKTIVNRIAYLGRRRAD